MASPNRSSTEANIYQFDSILTSGDQVAEHFTAALSSASADEEDGATFSRSRNYFVVVYGQKNT